MKTRFTFSCELASILGLLINSMAVSLLVKSALGISTISSLPLVIHTIIPKLSLGTWTTIIQTITLVILMLLTKQFKPIYLSSFLIGVVFGILVDIQNLWITKLPSEIIFTIIYFILGWIMISFGATLFMLCKLPVMPFDLFVRDLSIAKNKQFSKVKTLVDIIFVSSSLILSLVFLKQIVGVGIGTIIMMFGTGTLMKFHNIILNQYFDFKLTTSFGNKLSELSKIK